MHIVVIGGIYTLGLLFGVVLWLVRGDHYGWVWWAWGIGAVIWSMYRYRKLSECNGADQSLDYNRTHGAYVVVYSDGKVSQPFCKDVAEAYSRLFGGQVRRLKDFNQWGR